MRGIQFSDGGKGRKEGRVGRFVRKAAEMKQAKLEDTVKDYNNLLKEKLQTEDGKLPDPKTLTTWTNNFSDIAQFTFGDLYSHLVGREEKNTRRKPDINLCSFKSQGL